MTFLTLLPLYGHVQYSDERAIVTISVTVFTILGIIIYPYAKAEILKEKIDRAKKILQALSLHNDHWSKTPSIKEIEILYPQILTALSVKSTGTIEQEISSEFNRYLNHRFQKWTKQKIDFSFVWMEMEVVEITKAVHTGKGDFLSVYVSGRSVDFMKEKGTHSAMGNQTRKKKEFQDIIIFTYMNNKWVVNKIIRDAWFWQM